MSGRKLFSHAGLSAREGKLSSLECCKCEEMDGICMENRTYICIYFFGRRGRNEVGMYICVVRMKLKSVMWNSRERSYDVR